MGWDYHVEFPHPHQHTGVPFDSRPKMPDMKVQVKTIWFDRSTVDVDLAAADRLAGWDYPSFIVLLRMNMDLTYKDMHVIHLIDDNLAMILKALRRAEAEGSLSIKKRTITFSIRHGVEAAVEGRALTDAFRAAIGEKPDTYVVRKREQRKNLGFGPRPIHLTFSLKAESEDEVLNVFLGLKKGEATQFDADEMRFGIPLPMERHQTAMVEIRPHSQGSCELVMTSSLGDRKRVIFEGDLYMASTTVTALGAWKLRVTSPLMELLCSRDERKATFTIAAKPDMRIPLRDSIKIARAHLIVALGRGAAEVRKAGKRLLVFTINETPSPTLQREAESRLEFLLNLERLLYEAGAQDLAINDDDIASNIGSIEFALRAQRPGNGISVRLQVTPKGGGPTIPPEIEGIFASQLSFPGVTIAFWASMRVTVTEEGGVMTLNCSGMLLRDITRLLAGQTVDDFVADASAETGIGLVIRTNAVYESEDVLPEVGNDHLQRLIV